MAEMTPRTEALIKELHEKIDELRPIFSQIRIELVGPVLAELLAMYLAYHADDIRSNVRNSLIELIDGLTEYYAPRAQGLGQQISGKDYEVALSVNVKAAMAEAPEVAEAVRDLSARLRQGLVGVKVGDEEAVMELLKSMGAEPIDEEEAQEVEAALAEALRGRGKLS